MTSQRTRERLVRRLREEGIRDSAVLEAILNTPRHLFVDEALSSRAYEDTALPIGYQQTISQPWVVARMSELLLAGGACSRVLEIGTGSGYQAAVLARLVEKVYTIERIEALVTQVRKRFRGLSLRNIRVRHEDGFGGWPEQGPYDGIIVTAAPERVPEQLLPQLAEGGRMVLPVGPRSGQRLSLITRVGGEFHQEDHESVVFVPMLPGNG